MLRANRHFVWSVLLIVAVLVNLLNVNVALADDGTPPPPPTEAPTEPPVEPTEPPVVAETPVSTETVPVSEKQTPAEETTEVSEILEAMPENTELVVLDENGNPVPLASQEAAEIALEADPIWCPVGVSPIPNAGGCTTDFATPAALLTFLQTNQGIALYQQAGVIYLESATTVNVPVFIDAAVFPTFKNYALTVKGGWNNVNSAPAGTTTTFDSNSTSTNAYLQVGSLANPWVGSVTIQDIFIQDNTVSNAGSVQVYTTNGSVTLNNVDIDDIDDATAINVVVSGTGNVNLTGVDISDGTNGSGITVATNSGSISLADVDVTNQSNGFTANLQSQSGNITITNGASNGSTFDGGSDSLGFVATTNTGSITITGAVGGGNQITYTDADGTANGATLSAPTVTLTRVTADNNDMNGIQISNANTITLNQVISTNNGTSVTGPDLGSGVRVFGTGSTVVNINGGTFSNNERYPIEISNGTFTIISAPSMSGNGEGNSIVVDNTPPSMSPSMSCSLPGNAGWCRGTITINWGVSDAQSAVNTSGCQTTFSTNTSPAGTTLSCTATSTGGTTAGSVTVLRDGTAPNTTGTRSPSANGNGWNNTNVIVTFTGTDANSGIASCTAPVTITTEGANQPATGNCTDVAGNVDTETVNVSIDKTAPTVNASVIPAPNANGWNNSGVLIIFSGSDPGGSGVPFLGGCSPLLGGSSAEGAGQIQTSTCTDRAGNSGSTTVTLNIDLTNPTAAATKSPLPNANGWNNTDVVVTFTGTDAVSGIASCTPPLTVSTEGVNQSRSGTCTDLAGRGSNTATANNINIDKTPPAISFVSRTPPNGNGWNNGSVTVTWSCTDALSGVVSSTISQMVNTDGANQSVTGTCQDLAGNTSSNTQSGINIDTTPPTLNLPSNITAEATGPSGAIVNYSASASDLLDSSLTFGCSPSSGSTFPLGTTTVTCTAQDDAGNTASGGFNVTVQDTTPPVLTLPADMTLEATSASGAVATFSASATDIVDGSLPVTCVPPSGSTFPLGTTTVTCTAVDDTGNTVSGGFDVTIQDTTPPALTLPADMTLEATGPAGVVATFSASATDIVDGSLPVTCVPASGSTFPLGTTTVTCMAQDDAGNIASDGFDVTVQDTTPPVLSLPANMTLEATSSAGAVATFSASATDIVDGSLPVTCVPASGSTFPLGTTSVNCSVTDSNSNTSSENFNVTVQDTTAPVITPVADINLVTANKFGVVLNYAPPATFDSVDGSGVATCNPAPGSLFPQDNTTVTCTATDNEGNTSSITFNVYIDYDKAAPLIETGSAGALILVTGGELIDLECNTTVSAFGVIVKFHNLCDYQAVINRVAVNGLPGALPNGYTFVEGLEVQVLANGQALRSLPNTSGVEMNFPLSDNATYAVLHWNNGRWVEITQSMDINNLLKILSTDAAVELYKMSTSSVKSNNVLTTELTGTFILVKK